MHWDELWGYEVRDFWIIAEDLHNILNNIMDLRKEYCKALP